MAAAIKKHNGDAVYAIDVVASIFQQMNLVDRYVIVTADGEEIAYRATCAFFATGGISGEGENGGG